MLFPFLLSFSFFSSAAAADWVGLGWPGLATATAAALIPSQALRARAALPWVPKSHQITKREGAASPLVSGSVRWFSTYVLLLYTIVYLDR